MALLCSQLRLANMRRATTVARSASNHVLPAATTLVAADAEVSVRLHAQPSTRDLAWLRHLPSASLVATTSAASFLMNQRSPSHTKCMPNSTTRIASASRAFHTSSLPLLQRRSRGSRFLVDPLDNSSESSASSKPTPAADAAPGSASDSGSNPPDDGSSKSPPAPPSDGGDHDGGSEHDNSENDDGDSKDDKTVPVRGGRTNRNIKSNNGKSQRPQTAEAVVRGRPIRRPLNSSSSLARIPIDNNSSSKSGSSNSGSSGSSSSAIERIIVPEKYPQLLAIPLTRRPLFPGFYKSLYIKEPRVIQAIQSLVERRQPYIGIFLAKDENTDADVVTDIDQVHRIGVFAQITNTYQTGPDNSALTVVVYPHRRIRLSDLVSPPSNQALEADIHEISVGDSDKPQTLIDGGSIGSDKSTNVESTLSSSDFEPINAPLIQYGVPLANVDNLIDEPYNPENRLIKAITSEIINVLKEISQLNPLLRDQIISISVQTGNMLLDPSKLADFAAAVSSGEPQELQSVLESLVVEERLHKALVVLKKELANAKLQQEISKEVDRKMTRKQQEYFLMEQLKGIKKELGMDTDGKEKLVEKFKEKAAKLKMPETAKRVFEEELNKLQHLESAASEFNVTRNYLDWLTQIPWGQFSKENFDVKHAAAVLDEDHYGLKDVKERILEFIAVGKLRGTVEGKIITMVGPPGVGKTSVGKSIAHALGREFYRFSVGGLSDVAEIKGHRRTYVGAMPGKVVQALKKVQTENPLIMIDEIDKLGRGHQGDPASALLELLDPEQNSSFLDHYMDVPIDLSKVLFVCTANTLETIPAPLLDRMEVITLSGYVAEEKVAIASKYLAPAARTACGLNDYDVTLTESAIEALIKQYCRESGVRNLKKQIEKIYRKAAFQIVKETGDVAAADSSKAASSSETDKNEIVVESNKDDGKSILPLVITPDNLKDYVGSPIFTTDRMYDKTPPGVVMGLAWTQMGGSSLFIESVLESALKDDSKPSFHRTGHLGDVMKESTTIAYTYARSFLARRMPNNTFFDHASVHMHVPEGATPKDGPSAGVTMATSLLSLAMNQPVIRDVAMTGELTLTGKVLKIGGVKEKAIAAKRSGVKRIILPESNKSDWDELQEYVREGLEPSFVQWYDELFDIVFPKEVITTTSS